MYGLLAVIKLVLLIVLVLFGLIAGLISTFLPLGLYLSLAALWHRVVTILVGASVQYSGSGFRPGTLLVSNHVSWLDISVLGSRLPVVFLAKAEIQNWPILGWVVKKAGTLFIERGKGASKAVSDLTRSLGNKQSALIFPEGRTTDGSRVRRFQPRLIQSAIDAGVKVQPVAIRYVYKDGSRVSRVCYEGDVGFLESVWNTLKGPGFLAQVHVFEPLQSHTSRDYLSKLSQKKVSIWVENS